MGKSVTTRSVAPLLAVDIMFNLLVPFAYLSFFHIEDPGFALGMMALLNAARIALWIPILVRLLQPADRFSRSIEIAQTEAGLRRADDALQTVPMRFSILYAVLFGLQDFVLTAILLYWTPDRAAL